MDSISVQTERSNLRRILVDPHKAALLQLQELPLKFSSIKSRVYKKRVLFFSLTKNLYNLREIFHRAKQLDIFTGRGFLERHDTYELKKRKKRK